MNTYSNPVSFRIKSAVTLVRSAHEAATAGLALRDRYYFGPEELDRFDVLSHVALDLSAGEPSPRDLHRLARILGELTDPDRAAFEALVRINA